ncbi:hypothetical protein [Microbacterium sp. 3J1]|uniref:hypothetical protein n=1 Tax=Microbacterium sp. 3J1 TaxID=861269 RepID=UPI000A75CE22|nr:hypothetical protein [Microbacterium sp. 3J1]
MNIFEKVQETRPEVEGADENISVARALLLTAIAAEQQPARPRAARRPWIVAGGLLGIGAAVTAGVLVVGGLTPTTGGVEAVPVAPRPSVGPSPLPTSEPTAEATSEPLTAAGVFGAAGASAGAFTGLTAAPGQYVRVTTATATIVYSGADGTWGEYAADRSSATSAWTVSSNTETYLPADQYGEWRYVGRPVQLGDLYGADAGARSQKYLQEVAHSSYDPYGVSGGAGAPWPTTAGDSLAAFYEAMPKDPAQLIVWIDEHQETPPEADDAKVGWLLVDLLARNGGSPEARAAMYASLSMLEGFVVIAAVGDLVTVALDTPVDDLAGNLTIQRRTATIDLASGLVTETTMTTGSGSALVPDAVPDQRSVYSTTVVNGAP